MKILVTGAAGFIGRHTVRHLLDRDHLVRAFDRRSMRDCSWVEEVEKVVVGDLRDVDAVASAVDTVDAVVHLAAETDARVQRASDRKQMVETNIVGTEMLLDAMEAEDVERIVFASSAAVYVPSSLQVNTSGTKEMGSTYARSKHIGEALVSARMRLGRVLRFSNVYGPGGNGVIDRWLRAAQDGQPLLLFGNGRQVRDYIHVEDVARAISAALTSAGAPDLMNISTGVGTSLAELAAEFAGIFGSVRLDRLPAADGDVGASILKPDGWFADNVGYRALQPALTHLAKEQRKG